MAHTVQTFLRMFAELTRATSQPDLVAQKALSQGFELHFLYIPVFIRFSLPSWGLGPSAWPGGRHSHREGRRRGGAWGCPRGLGGHGLGEGGDSCIIIYIYTCHRVQWSPPPGDGDCLGMVMSPPPLWVVGWTLEVPMGSTLEGLQP